MKHVSQTPAKSIAKGMIVLLSLLKKTAAAFLVAATVAASGAVCGVYGSADESAGAAEASGLFMHSSADREFGGEHRPRRVLAVEVGRCPEFHEVRRTGFWKILPPDDGADVHDAHAGVRTIVMKERVDSGRRER